MAERFATADDIPSLVEVINDAYLVEAFFVRGPRIDADEVRALMARGRFLVVPATDGIGLDAGVYIEARGERGYLGLLSVRTAAQGRGLGSAMLQAAERALSDTCHTVGIHVVDVRTDLDPFYRRRGYERVGHRPFEDVDRLIPPHTGVKFVVMEKRLRPPVQSGGRGTSISNPGNS